MKPFRSYLLFLLFGCCHAQNVFEIITATKRYEINANDVIEYKLKGQHRYKTDVVVNMNDSCLLLNKGSFIKISNIKALRFRRESHLLRTLNGVCFIGGIGYVSLNVINNLLLENSLKVDPKAIYISASFIVAGVILKLIRIKHVRIRKKTSIKIIDRDFKNLEK